MFTTQELTEIKAALKAVYKTIRPCFGTRTSDGYLDTRAAEESAARIVAAKISSKSS